MSSLGVLKILFEFGVSDVEDGLRPMVKPPHVNLTCTVRFVPVKTELLAAGRGLRSDASVESFEGSLIVN